MKLWRELSIGERIALTFMIVLALLLALALFGYLTGRWEDDDNSANIFGLASAQTRSELCMDGETREGVRKLMLEALDEALKEKIKDLFDVWLRDATGQPARASKGMDAALKAYVSARGSAMKFNPPECPP